MVSNFSPLNWKRLPALGDAGMYLGIALTQINRKNGFESVFLEMSEGYCRVVLSSKS